MICTIALILFPMAIGMCLCFAEESGHRHFFSRIIDKIEDHFEGR